MQAAPVRIAGRQDKFLLRALICEIFVIEPHELLDHPIWLSLQHAQITKFRDDFISIPEDAIRNLQYQDPFNNKWYKLPIGYKENLVALIAYVHYLSRK